MIHAAIPHSLSVFKGHYMNICAPTKKQSQGIDCHYSILIPRVLGSELSYAKIIFNIRHILITLISVIRSTFVQKDPPYTLIRGSNPYVFTWWKTYITELTTFCYDSPFSGKNRPPLRSMTRIRLLQSTSHFCVAGTRFDSGNDY